MTLMEAVELAYRAQDIQHELLVELSKLENGGHCLIGPSGRMGFSSLDAVEKYLMTVELSIKELRQKIENHTAAGLAKKAENIKAIMQRIETLGASA
jgi:hypothetical protein